MAQHQDDTKRGGSGNFANDRERASEAGKKGGQHSNNQQSQSGGQRGQQGGNFADDRERASEAGKKGGSR